jgi:hypothetical protein
VAFSWSEPNSCPKQGHRKRENTVIPNHSTFPGSEKTSDFGFPIGVECTLMRPRIAAAGIYGISDLWEWWHRLDPNDPDDGNELDRYGRYTNLQRYLQWLARRGSAHRHDTVTRSIRRQSVTARPSSKRLRRRPWFGGVATAADAVQNSLR